MPKLEIKILHEDAEFVVVEKPSGMLSVPGRGPEKADCVTARVRALFPECIEQPAPHRLDMDTSGILVVALTSEAHRNLSIQFQNRDTKKRYVALLDGILEGESSGTIELPFRLDVDNRPHQIYDPKYGKMGVSHWRKFGDEGGYSRIEFIPVTGRTHQLRVHAAHEKGLGIPILGDPLYGNGVGPAEMKLHACELIFAHPVTGKEMSFYSEAPF